MRLSMLILSVVVLAVAACDEVPRDPEGTLEKVHEGGLRVGVIENPPWTRHENGVVSGVEVALIEQFADELGAEVTWVRGGESSLMPALERFELHLVVGGLTDGSPWRGRVGLSRPYFTNRFVVGVPTGLRMDSVADELVAVPADRPMLIALAREQDAEVVTVADLSEAEVDAVVAPAWQLATLDREPSAIELHREKHVMAVPPGENGWLMRLDRFLHQQAGDLPDRLRREKERRP